MVVLIVAGAWLTAPAMAASEQGCTVWVNLSWNVDPPQALDSWTNATGSQTTLLASGRAYDFRAGCNCGHQVTLTSSCGESSGPSQSPTFEKTFTSADMSSDLNDTWVRATCQETGQECLVEFTVLDMFFNPFDRVPPATSASVDLIFSYCLCLSGGRQVELGWHRDSGTSGSMTHLDPTATTEPETTVTLRGGEQTNTRGGKNMRLYAWVTYGIPAATRDFSVCAHPKDFHQRHASVKDEGRLYFEYEWGSDSDNLEHLDECLVGEHVDYPGPPPDPPFHATFTDPKVMNRWGYEGMMGDLHSVCQPKYGEYITAGPARSYVATQNYRFHCKRCVPEGDEKQLSWGVVFPGYGWIDLERHVEYHVDDWRHRLRKSGLEACVPLPYPLD